MSLMADHDRRARVHGQAQGEFSAEAEADFVALQLAALMDGLAIQFALDDPDVTGERMAEVLVVTAQQVLACDLTSYRDRRERR
jgi:hypothetical protein